MESMPDSAFQGELIKGIRNQFIQDKDNLEIVLDLATGRDYKVTQKYDETENVFNLVIGLKR
jgi:hypothetical protein